MLFKTVFVCAVTLFSANGALGAAIDKSSEVEARAALVATDAYSACNCPNNCKHARGDSCKYYSGPSDNSEVTTGHCYFPNANPGASLECVA
ncbi:hypothetical protein SCUP234_03993 [Seiridium cupressi]|uniref:Uncharacterized protein n=1 Tax=Seiridium unicorne TaxID=138068 RepID=A0ABR2V487_9PEZI